MRKFVKSFSYALQGLKIGWGEERNFRTQIILGIAVLALAWLLKLSFLEWALLILAITLVLAAELANTAAEEILDLLEKRHQHQVGKIKDVAAAMVLVFSLGALILGVLVFYNRLFS